MIFASTEGGKVIALSFDDEVEGGEDGGAEGGKVIALSSDDEVEGGGDCRCQNRRISGRVSRTVRLGSMVTGNRRHNVYPGSGPLYGGNTLRPA